MAAALPGPRSVLVGGAWVLLRCLADGGDHLRMAPFWRPFAGAAHLEPEPPFVAVVEQEQHLAPDPGKRAGDGGAPDAARRAAGGLVVEELVAHGGFEHAPGQAAE